MIFRIAVMLPIIRGNFTCSGLLSGADKMRVLINDILKLSQISRQEIVHTK